MYRSVRATVSLVIALLMASMLVTAAPAGAEIIDTDTVNLSAPGGAFGTGDIFTILGRGSWEDPALVDWGDIRNDRHLRVRGVVASFHLWGGCTDVRIRAMSGFQVLETRTYPVCNGAFGASNRVVTSDFGSPAINRVEICLRPDGERPVCATRHRPALPSPFIALTATFA